MSFKEYLHIERYGNDEVQGIELGECYVFPKLDGTNGSLWLDGDTFCGGSRKRQLAIGDDNAGFYAAMLDNANVRCFFEHHKHLRLFGEWLVPHSFKGYRPDAWRKFYIFDVYDDINHKYLAYPDYQPLLEQFNLDYIAPLCVMKNASYDNLLIELNNNTYLIPDGGGIGEGIVIKNYDFVNRYGRLAYAKIVANHFKEKHAKAQPTVKLMGEPVESKIVTKYVDGPLINKVFSKIVNENGGWNSKYIPRLFSEVYHDLITEELWDILKFYKNPTIDFKSLNGLVIQQVKLFKPELF